MNAEFLVIPYPGTWINFAVSSCVILRKHLRPFRLHLNARNRWHLNPALFSIHIDVFLSFCPISKSGWPQSASLKKSSEIEEDDATLLRDALAELGHKPHKRGYTLHNTIIVPSNSTPVTAMPLPTFLTPILGYSQWQQYLTPTTPQLPHPSTPHTHTLLRIPKTPRLR
jgi:hypothetical protein